MYTSIIFWTSSSVMVYGRGPLGQSYVTDILKRSLATKLIGFSLGQAYMADHYKSLSHSGDGSKPFFPDPLPECSDNNSESFDALPAIDPPQALGRGELQIM